MDTEYVVALVVIILTGPLCAWSGYRLGYFRGYVAARHLFVQSLKKNVIFWSHNGVSKRWDASKAENE